MLILLGLITSVVVGELSVYWVHRLQHHPRVRDKGHEYHHAHAEPRSWWLEFWSYLRPGTIPITIFGGLFWLVFDAQFAIAWWFGMLLYMAFAAFVHEIYHTDPNLIFWSRPVHYFHHEHNQWKHNFAFTNTLLDRAFGTFKDDPTWVRKRVPLTRVLQIKWF